VGRKIAPARIPVGEVPEVQSMRYDVDEDFKEGAVLVYEGGATGELIEDDSDPTPIVGVALEAANSKPGYDMGHSPTVVTGRVQEVSVAKANRSTTFSGRMVNGAVDPVTPALTDIGVLYGLAKVGNDWVVNQAETSATRVMVTDIDIPNKFVLFKFMEAHLANP
jgi:hypothetical protein